jgi:hypothetical protein
MVLPLFSAYHNHSCEFNKIIGFLLPGTEIWTVNVAISKDPFFHLHICIHIIIK